ncbi:MAG: hypothetical protein ACK5BE_01375 [Alphaproteobacteria bacterium]|jgi:hypothetical protein
MVENTTDENYIILNGDRMYMSRMVGYYEPHIYGAKLKINRHQNTIVKFLQDIGAEPTFISSILNNIGIYDLTDGLQIITSEDFKELVLNFLDLNFGTEDEPLKFTPHNLSSILHGSKLEAIKIVRALINNKDILATLLKASTPTDISRDLHPIRKPEEVVPALEKIRDTEAEKIIKWLSQETPGATIQASKKRDGITI